MGEERIEPKVGVVIVAVLSEDRVDYWKNLSSRFEVAKHDTAKYKDAYD